MNAVPRNQGESTGDGNRAADDNSETQKRQALAAVDLGAESCRVSLLRWVNGQPEICLAHRFPNSASDNGTGLRWDIGVICKGVEDGLRACAQLAPEGIASIGVDGWAVDYVRLGADGRPTDNPFCYRDERTTASLKRVHSRISPERLYELTGVQILTLNTLYQLAADREAEQNLPWVNVPEFVIHWLGGRRVSEYTNATTTQLLGVQDRAWCPEVFASAGLEFGAAPPLVSPGTDIGHLQGPLASVPQFRETRLIAPACHDTASAIAGIPGQGDDWGFISSGTWSLIGTELDAPVVSEGCSKCKLQQRRRRRWQDLFPEERKWHVAAAAMHRSGDCKARFGRSSNWSQRALIFPLLSVCSMWISPIYCCRATCRRGSMRN
jgi:rhamnulokinase